MALRQRGWLVEGVDYSEDTVAALHELFPDLPIRIADVTQLDVPDGHYGGYISIGVVEHRREGPEPFLSEALRVLRSGGIAVITVPYLNSLRRLKARWGCYRGASHGLPFYQYAFSADEICEYLRSAWISNRWPTTVRWLQRHHRRVASCPTCFGAAEKTARDWTSHQSVAGSRPLWSHVGGSVSKTVMDTGKGNARVPTRSPETSRAASTNGSSCRPDPIKTSAAIVAQSPALLDYTSWGGRASGARQDAVRAPARHGSRHLRCMLFCPAA